MTLTLEPDTILEEVTVDRGDHRTHIVTPSDNQHIWIRDFNYTGLDIARIATEEGIEIEAICGFRWTPRRDPDHYPVCEGCMDEAGKRMRENGE